MIKDPNYDFSFSGLKTAVKKVVDGLKAPPHEVLADLAREVENSIVDVLLAKTKRAVEEHAARTVIVGGGVSANDHLREVFEKEFAEKVRVLFPPREFSTDNAVMIAVAGYFGAQKGAFTDAAQIHATGNLRLAK
jgi:N6-L-threonylcarbamoyladenine synthase